jgi:hypothetical protein
VNWERVAITPRARDDYAPHGPVLAGIRGATVVDWAFIREVFQRSDRGKCRECRGELTRPRSLCARCAGGRPGRGVDQYAVDPDRHGAFVFVDVGEPATMRWRALRWLAFTARQRARACLEYPALGRAPKVASDLLAGRSVYAVGPAWRGGVAAVDDAIADGRWAPIVGGVVVTIADGTALCLAFDGAATVVQQ